MVTPHRVFLIVWMINMLLLWGCAHDDIRKTGIELPTGQAEDALVADASWVPQTLGPAPQEPLTKAITPEITESLPISSKPQIQKPTSQHAESPKIHSPNPQPTRNAATQLTGTVFGEFPGVKTQWKERKEQLAIQLQEHERKKKELTMKLQLIEQVAELVSFTAKAYVVQAHYFLMEFTIENRTAYGIKDIAITCDQIAPTGTTIQSHTETLYDILKPSTRSIYSPIPYGNKHRQTQSLQCQITNFTVM